MCSGSLPRCRSQPRLIFSSFFTDSNCDASRVCWYLIESILPSAGEMLPIPLAATKAQSTTYTPLWSWRSLLFMNSSFFFFLWNLPQTHLCFAFLAIQEAALSEHCLGLPDLNLISTTPVSFHLPNELSKELPECLPLIVVPCFVGRVLLGCRIFWHKLSEVRV